MPTPLDLLDKYIFGGVPSNAVYDLLKTGWQKANERTWEELYLEAFAAALDDERPLLAHYGDQVSFEREDLQRVLHYDLGAAVATLSLSELTDKQFVQQLTAALVERQALVIGGHNLSQEDYVQLMHNLVRNATALFKSSVIQKQDAFQQAMVSQALHDHTLLRETQVYLEQRFELVLQALSLPPALKADIEAIRRTLEGGPPTPPAPIPTRVPESKARKLVGREDEIAWVCDQLQAGDSSTGSGQAVAALVGVRGIGGIGKTEVAIAAVEALGNHFAGQVIWLEGGPNDVFAIQGRLAEALGVRLEASELSTRADALHLALRSGPPRLVVLDDLRKRHLADFVHLKPPCPPCALLVTSRRSDLPLPDEAILRLDQLALDEAQALLTTLLPAGWLEREPGLAVEIAGFLECIPLALTLAARRARQIAMRLDGGAAAPLATLLDELRARRLQVLNQGEDPRRPDLSVVITFDASYGDLEPADQARLRRLGVFARNEFELAAMQAVWGDDQAMARQAVQRLASGGLVEETADDVWWMHDLLREYAGERLTRAGAEEAGAARLEHAGHWQHLLDTHELRSVADWQWLEQQRPEVERAANWLLDDWNQAPHQAVELANAISSHFPTYGLPQWERWMSAGIFAARTLGQHTSALRLQYSLAVHHLHRGDVGVAADMLEANLAVAREILATATTEEERAAGQKGVADALGSIAVLKARSGDVADALLLCNESLDIYKQLGHFLSMGLMFGFVGQLLMRQGDLADALLLYDEILVQFDEWGAVRERAVTLGEIAQLKVLSGDVEAAQALFQEALNIFEQIGDMRNKAGILGGIARLKARSGNLSDALLLHQERLQIYEQLGATRERAVVLGDIARLKAQRGNVDEAMELCQEALTVFGQIGDVRERAVALGDIARLEAQRGNVDEANGLLQEALTVFEKLGSSRERAVTLGEIADLKAQEGDVTGALSIHQERLNILEQLGFVRERAATLNDIARLKAKQGDVDEAALFQQEALTIFEQLGEVRSSAVILGDIAQLKAQDGKVNDAVFLHQKALALFEQLGDVHEQAETLNDIARLKAQDGKVNEAIVLHQQALTLFEQLGAIRERAVTLGEIGWLKAKDGDVADALSLHQDRLLIYEQLGDGRERAKTLRDIARLKAQGGDVIGALAAHQIRVDIYERLGDLHERAITQLSMANINMRMRRLDEAEMLLRNSLESIEESDDNNTKLAIIMAQLNVQLLRSLDNEQVTNVMNVLDRIEQSGGEGILDGFDLTNLAQFLSNPSSIAKLIVRIRHATEADDSHGSTSQP